MGSEDFSEKPGSDANDSIPLGAQFFDISPQESTPLDSDYSLNGPWYVRMADYKHLLTAGQSSSDGGFNAPLPFAEVVIGEAPVDVFDPPFAAKMAFQTGLLRWFDSFSEPQLARRLEHPETILPENLNISSLTPDQLREQIRLALDEQFGEIVSDPLREILTDPHLGPRYLSALHQFKDDPKALRNTSLNELPEDLWRALKDVYHRLKLWKRRQRRAEVKTQH